VLWTPWLYYSDHQFHIGVEMLLLPRHFFLITFSFRPALDILNRFEPIIARIRDLNVQQFTEPPSLCLACMTLAGAGGIVKGVGERRYVA